jgi:arylsulfatase A-like enzyme
MLMADHLRMDCVGAYGNKAIKTPHLDRISREGIRFQNAYTCTPGCADDATILSEDYCPS